MLFAVREFQITDLDQIVTLIYDTVHAINAQDYTLEQLEAWAPILLADERRERTPRLEESLSQNISYVSIRDKRSLVRAQIFSRTRYCLWPIPPC